MCSDSYVVFFFAKKLYGPSWFALPLHTKLNEKNVKHLHSFVIYCVCRGCPAAFHNTSRKCSVTAESQSRHQIVRV